MMVIANPIYDTVFKQLMQNKETATFMIETLLSAGTGCNNETVLELDVRPQEVVYYQQEKPEGLTLMRFDFVATLRNSSGEYKKVLIEIQKARNKGDIMRFRQYLASQYMIEDHIGTGEARRKEVLPIITIYLLGFNLPEWKAPVVKVGKFFENLYDNSPVNGKCDFTEKLTHECYVVQLPRIGDKYETRLQKLMTVFEQKYFMDDNGVIKNYPFPIDDEKIQTLVNLLHLTGSDPEERKLIDVEVEAWRVFNAVLNSETGEMQKTIKVQAKALEENARALEENARALEEKDRSLREKEKEIEELKRRLG